MESLTIRDRVKGAIIGTLIGDALGLGPHWFYNIDELREKYGSWINDYAPVKENPAYPKVSNSRSQLKPGDVSQTGQVYIQLLESITENSGYDEEDFTQRLDRLLATLDGTQSGGRYTDEDMRDVWHGRRNGFDWHHVGSYSYTANAAIRTPILAAYYSGNPGLAAKYALSNIQLTHINPLIVGQSIAFELTVSALINGVTMPQVSSTQ